LPSSGASTLESHGKAVEKKSLSNRSSIALLDPVTLSAEANWVAVSRSLIDNVSLRQYRD
jgi:hypothetical protein